MTRKRAVMWTMKTMGIKANGKCLSITIFGKRVGRIEHYKVFSSNGSTDEQKEAIEKDGTYRQIKQFLSGHARKMGIRDSLLIEPLLKVNNELRIGADRR